MALIFTLFFPLKTISRVWFYCEHLLVECFNFQLILLKFFIVLCFYNSKSSGFHCRANLYANVGLLTRIIHWGWLHDTGATFAAEWVHSGSLSWLYICLHDTTAKCHAGASHPGVSSPRLLYRGENFTPVRNLATVSCKRETTTRFGVKSVCR